MAQLTIQQASDLAIQHHQAGRLQVAEGLYRQILAQQPNNADALHHLGMLADQVGRHDIAVDLIRRAIASKPNYPEAYSNLGNALKGKGQVDEAIAAYRQAIALKPNHPAAYANLGAALQDKGQPEEAIAAYRQAIALKPDFPEAYSNLGSALKGKGQVDEAIAAYRQAIAIKPNYPEAYSNLGVALKDKGQLDEAIVACRQAIALKPDYPEPHFNLGVALQERAQLDEALAAYRQAIIRQPNYTQAYGNLGVVLSWLGQLDQAIAAYRQAIALKPDLPDAHSNLGNALKDKGKMEEAIAAYRQAIALKPDYPATHSNLVYGLQYHPAYDAQTIAEEHRRWHRQHAGPLKKFIQPHANDRNPDRRLRVGYVSPDFREHAVGRSLLPLFRQHSRERFEISCYAHVRRPDAMTRLFQQNADHWNNIVGLSDEQVVERIRQDQIDILVDLTLHMNDNRLLVFARKPAPVQVTYLAYCGSSGMDAIDYRLSDPHMDPLDADLSCYSETTIRLPETYWCYAPQPCPEPGSPPVLASGFVTFGCLNNSAKVSAPALELWARILLAVPNSRILLHAHDGTHRREVIDYFEQAGVSSARIEFVRNQPWESYIATYQRIDIALDPFPYAGGVTSLDGLWMGVPLVSLSGRTAVGRGGRSILYNLGLGDLVAFEEEQYLRLAVALAGDIPRLCQLRDSMRQRMEQSPLMDASRFALNIEAAYRQMWRTWCAAGH